MSDRQSGAGILVARVIGPFGAPPALPTASPFGPTKLILQDIARRREQRQVVDVEAERVRIVIVSLHGELFAFRGEHVKEILSVLPVFPVPGTPEGFPGVINVRGQVEPVVDLMRWRGFPHLTRRPSTESSSARRAESAPASS